MIGLPDVLVSELNIRTQKNDSMGFVVWQYSYINMYVSNRGRPQDGWECHMKFRFQRPARLAISPWNDERLLVCTTLI
jgi:hypothetical protein